MSGDSYGDLMDVLIRAAQREDAVAIAAIYNHYVCDTVCTFEVTAVSVEQMVDRIESVLGLGLPWLVAHAEDQLIGYAYASQWKPRHAYRFSVESSVYLDAARCGQGVGSRLYAALLAQLRTLPVHTVVGGVALPNPRSEALHRRLGFQQAALFAQMVYQHGRWIDVAYWQ